MRYYEIVFIIHPDSNDQISSIINRYIRIISDSGGVVHRLENWGHRQLAYPIQKVNKAYYILLNIEVGQNVINQLDNDFRFNNSILRYIIMRTTCIFTNPSAMMKKREETRELSVNYDKN